MKTKIILALILFLIASSITAKPTKAAPSPQTTKQAIRNEIKAEVKVQAQEKFINRQENIATESKGRNKLILLKRPAHLTNAAVTAKNDSNKSLTLAEGDKTYTVNTTSATMYRRHFWGKSSFEEISVGDKINVWGKWTDEGQTTIEAKMIRNLSVMKRFGVFFGDIKTKGSDNFVISTIGRGDQTVYFTSQTKFINIKGQKITYSDISTGDRIRVRGLWDKTLSKITDVEEIKDFSLPKTTTPTP